MLVADDEDLVRRQARRFLERLGFDVVEASNGSEALAVARERGETLVVALLDVTMPGASGVDTMRDLRRMRADLPVVLTSGYAAEQALAELGDEAVLFVSKPFSGAELGARIREALEMEWRNAPS